MNINFSEIKSPQTFKAKDINLKLASTPIRYYRHGWQSWSLAAWTDLSPFPVQKPAIFHPLQTDAAYVHEKNPHGSWLGAVEFADGNILLLGALSTDAHVFLVGDQLKGQSEADEIEWLVAYGQEIQVFGEYVEELGRRFGRADKNHIPRVWCSWYSLYTAIDEKILYETFDKLGSLPFDVLQVDDGWQQDIGDWEANEKFSSGMTALAEKIKSTGRRAGLWLAPLIVAKSSRLYREHKDWLLCDEKGKLTSAGFNWGQDLFALDTTHPGVISWLVALMKQVRSWGFDYYKLDFLYGGALKGERHKDMPREAAYRECLRYMREAMGEGSFFLTCGTPIIPALGLCDAIRIGPDVSHEWENYRNETLLQNFATPGAKNAIRTVVHRLWLKPLVHIDPDVEYFVTRENTLEETHKSQLRDLALICDFKATSDLPQWMTPENREDIHSFLTAETDSTQVSRYTYKIDDRLVDFSSAVELPKPPTGPSSLWGRFLGWLGDWKFVLRIMKKMDDDSLLKRVARIDQGAGDAKSVVQ
ncbi:MAG TPA: alpha-galactosidase [Anaerolineales bacterium]|nr:alpha-galactosidase [Anaerolineales bacterium]HNK62614.1 alpha-galactosidase [Anaerolineales bacterium]HNN13750.1 alpha-galactosidase [Anaerolineales bacterium]